MERGNPWKRISFALEKGTPLKRIPFALERRKPLEVNLIHLEKGTRWIGENPQEANPIRFGEGDSPEANPIRCGEGGAP